MMGSAGCVSALSVDRPNRVWLLDLSSKLDPSTEFHGFDSDITQVSPKEWLPENIKLQEWNVFGDVPADLVSKFDIVHVRLFAWVTDADPKPVLRNLLKLLSKCPPCHF